MSRPVKTAGCSDTEVRPRGCRELVQVHGLPIGEQGVQRRRRDTARALNSAATPTDDDHTDDDRRAQRRPR